MKKTYVTPEVEYINFYSEEYIAAETSIGTGDEAADGDTGFWGN